MQTIYRPGAWRLIVRPGLLVALPPEADERMVTRLWARTHEDPSLAAVIGVLAQDGGALTALPSFAAIVLEGDDVRVALRGDVDVTIVAEQAEHLSGARVTTWSERFVSGATAIELRTGPTTDATALPVHTGVVLASAATVSVSVSVPDSAVAHGQAPLVPAQEHTTARAQDDDAARAQEPAVRAEEAVGHAREDARPDPVSEPLGQTTILPTDMTLPPSDEGADELWGTVISVPTVAREERAPAAPADAIPAGAVPVDAVPAASDLGDHDGATISLAELRARREQSSPSPDASTVAAPAAATPAGATPGVPGTAATTGRIRMSTGQVVDLDRTVIIGRRPRSSRAGGSDLPHLIAVDSPQQDISRSHLEVRPEGDTVVVIDLHATNGSTLLRPGADPVRLHPGEQTLVLSGDIVDLGDGVTVAFEDLP